MSSPELKSVAVDGRPVSFRSAGEGPALVLLHGFLCDSRCWRRQLSDLSDRFTVIAWDAPGAGATPDPPDPFTITDWARSLVGFLDVMGVERAHILGLSWGGLLAQELYRVDPTRVLGLILADTYAGWKGSLGSSVAEQRLARCIGESSLPPEEFVARWVPVEFFTDAAPPELAAEMAAVVADFHPVGFRLMAKALADEDTTEFLPRIEVPTLLLWGEEDRRSPVGIAEQFRDAIPGAELVVLPRAAHISNMERPDAFNAEVRRFCLSHLPH
jgi:pimeloyl-ACP methyl ester carboxylesterase